MSSIQSHLSVDSFSSPSGAAHFGFGKDSIRYLRARHRTTPETDTLDFWKIYNGDLRHDLNTAIDESSVLFLVL
jgi:hypothetical protein